jgi:predicted TPR repeat methyltransferase
VLERTTRLAPDNVTAWHNLSVTLVQLGRSEEAVAAFSRKSTPWTGEIAGGDVAMEYAAAAPSYDDNQLHRSFGPRLWAFARRIAPESRFGRVLDLGCGTGLLGLSLPSSVEVLVGIDLSPDMLAVAAKRGRYHRLLQGDLVAVMTRLAERFDAVFSSCVLYHLADLAPVFAQAARLLAPGGVFFFSVDPSADGQDIGITGPGEYCHSRPYLRRLAGEAAMAEIAIAIAVHRATPGFYCAFRKE